MRTSALVRLAAGLTAALLGLTVVGVSPALADNTPLPVVVDDTVSLYPGQMTQINVLDNDSSPDGDDLALCRFPEPDLTGNVAVVATEVTSLLGGGPGEVMVGAATKKPGTHTITYYVCDHVHLVEAHLIVEVKAVSPVKVHKIAGKPGKLKVTNTNTATVSFWYGDKRAPRPDGKVRIPAGKTQVVTVRRHTVVWLAWIGLSSGKASMFSSPGIADAGVVRGIKLRPGTALPPPKHHPGSPRAAGWYAAAQAR
jgi:hypothetical protein